MSVRLRCSWRVRSHSRTRERSSRRLLPVMLGEEIHNLNAREDFLTCGVFLGRVFLARSAALAPRAHRARDRARQPQPTTVQPITSVRREQRDTILLIRERGEPVHFEAPSDEPQHVLDVLLRDPFPVSCGDLVDRLRGHTRLHDTADRRKPLCSHESRVSRARGGSARSARWGAGDQLLGVEGLP
jgi:hypothetical protein